MEINEILQGLLEQSPLVAFSGYCLWKIWGEYKAEKVKKDTMAEALIKITLLWDERYSKESADERDIKELMKEIRDFVRDLTKEKDVK